MEIIETIKKFEEQIIVNGTLPDLWDFCRLLTETIESTEDQEYKLELANKCSFYSQQYTDIVQQNKNLKTEIDEHVYTALIFLGKSLFVINEEDEKVISIFTLAGQFAPERNDHLYQLALVYKKRENYKDMMTVCTRMMQSHRLIPRQYSLLINDKIYVDSPEKDLIALHKEALNGLLNVKRPEEKFNFRINAEQRKRIFIVDNFYENPDEIREFALNQVEYKEDLRFYKGKRSTKQYLFPGLKEKFEQIMGEKIRIWEEHNMNGVFQITTAEDKQVYHFDEQEWAGMIYLTPNAPIQSGTRLHRSKINGAVDSRHPDVNSAFNGDFFDSTRFDIVANAANIYNRLVIMDARCIHSAGDYFGNNDETGRLIHLFFFD